VNEHQYLPDREKLSILAATILLANTLTRFLDISSSTVTLQIFGVLFPISINLNMVILLLNLGITASGTQWLIQSHPGLKNQRTYQHWFVPAFTSWVVSFPISQLPFGFTWLASLFFGGVVVILVLIAEYITVDPEDSRHPLAASGLTAVSFAIYLAFAIFIYNASVRLILLLPAILLAGFLVSLRTFQLRFFGQWAFLEAGTIALVNAQIAAALHYWPVTPIAFGLALLGPTYALTSFMTNLGESEPVSQALLEPSIILVLIWGAAYLNR
jgi:hypothetical protein